MVIFLLGSVLYSQEKDKPFERGLVFSAKVNYHIIDKYSFPSGLGGNLSGEIGFGKGWFLGVQLDYWSKDNVTIQDFYGENIQTDYSTYGYNFMIKKSLFYKPLNISFGISGGSYTIKEKYHPLSSYNEKENVFFNMILSTAIDVKIFKNLYITGEFSLYQLIQLAHSGRSLPIINFNIGPTYYIKVQ